MTVTGAAHPPRNAARTRQRLLDTAARLFARNGYANTSVRDIADAAGANVSLINRYFESKEGLFAACLARLPRCPGILFGSQEHLLLLAHDPGTEGTKQTRLEALQAFGAALSEDVDRPDDDTIAAQGQLVLAAAIGIALVRSAGLHPLASAREPLTGLLHELAGFLMRQPTAIR
ncbi:TetR family transcriptional regulator [Amycolatopsis sp. RTGN1]|uniref:TetR family transcriptional regulator n=1 Tax=Amycolatopsis ponsaeliensis TaxID=2992142 RepID=UPI0025513957|nr:TetR family transcriptional regulator [Amycolatopsis sp. RTGN1]